MRRDLFFVIVETMKKSKNYIALFYVLAIFIAIPIFNKGTFENITVHKTEVFYLVSVLTLVFYVLASVIDDVTKRADEEPFEPVTSRMNIAMGLFGAAVLISTVFSGSIKDAVYGVSGFSTGALFLIILVLSYFFLSQYLVCYEQIFHVIVVASIFPTIVSLANRIGIDLLNMYADDVDSRYSLYISTFGNYGWYSEYMAVVIPISIYMFINSAKPLIKALYGAYLIMAAAAVFLCATDMLIISSIAALVIVLAWKFGLFKKKEITGGTSTESAIIKKLPILFAVAMILYFIAVVIVSGHYDWGNGRGYIWRISLDLFNSLSIKEKLIGVGPNRFMYALNDYLAIHPEEAVTYNERFNELALTSAHSEVLDYLINIGIVGLIAYLYMIYSAAVTFIKGGFGDRCKEVAAVVAAAYFIYSLCNFSIVCATPHFFAMLGIIACEEEAEKGARNAGV